jgi:DNA-directed RNA polymerase specialized sigma24 family protein
LVLNPWPDANVFARRKRSSTEVSEDRLAAARRLAIKDKIVAAYEAYQRKEPGSADALMALVRDFAYSKMQRLTFDLPSGAMDADDFAQDVALEVWMRLDTHTGETGESFYAWVHKIAFNHRVDTFHALLTEKRERASLHHEITEDDETFEDDNPEIYRSALGVDMTKWTEKDDFGTVVWPSRGS